MVAFVHMCFLRLEPENRKPEHPETGGAAGFRHTQRRIATVTHLTHHTPAGKPRSSSLIGIRSLVTGDAFNGPNRE